MFAHALFLSTAKGTRLVAKKKANKLDAQQMRRLYQDYMAQSADKSTVLSPSTSNVVIGLRIPFAFEILLDCNVLPLGVVFELLGEPGSNKSTLAYEMVRWFYEAGGYGDVFITEGKNSPALASAIIGYPDELGGTAFTCFSSDSMDQWQKGLLLRISELTKQFRNGNSSVGLPKNYAPIPAIYVVDSIMGQMLQKSNDNISTDGASGFGYATEAGSLTKYMRVLQVAVASQPMLALLVNHMKVDQIDAFRTSVRSPGGAQVKFQATYRVQLKKLAKTREVDLERNAAFIRGYTLKMSVVKNSLGEDDREIIVPYRWWYDDVEAGENTRQRSRFNWDKAIVLALNDFVEQKHGRLPDFAKSSLQAKLDNVVHYRHVKGDLYSSKTYDIPANDPVTAEELGAKIQADEGVLQGLRQLYGLKCYERWDVDSNYYEVRRRLVKQAESDLFRVRE